MPPVVADSSPIISLARAGQGPLLRAVLPEIIIPDAVYHEIAVGVGRAGADVVREGDWIVRVSLADLAILESINPHLHLGEREAIALAMERGLGLLIDEVSGRREALRLCIPVVTSLLVLREARAIGLIERVQPVLDQLLSTGFRLGQRLYQDFLSELGEL